MIDEPMLKIKPSFGLAIIFLIGGLFFCWPVYLFSKTLFVAGHLQMAPAVMVTLFGSSATVCFVAIYFMGALSVFRDRIVKYSIFGNQIKTIFLNEIVSWEETESERKDNKKIVIRTARRRFSISYLERGYDEVKEYLANLEQTGIMIADRSSYAQTRQKERSVRISKATIYVLLALCSLVIYSGLKVYLYPNRDYEDLQLSEVRDVADKAPDIYEGTGSDKAIKLHLANYPGLTFEISGIGYYATRAIDKIQKGDSVFLSIETSEYEKKITKEMSMTFWDKTDQPNQISVYELADNERQYLSLNNYMEANAQDEKAGIFIALIAFGGIVWGLWQLRKMRQNVPVQ